jgi:hypothetical protein
MWWPAVVKSEWELILDYGRSPNAYVIQRLQIQLEVLMMSGMLLETCWAFNERWNNKFYYKVASCWLFLLSLSRCFLPVMSLDVIVPAKFFPAVIPTYYSLSPKIVVYFCVYFFQAWYTRWRSWFSHYATSRKVAVSIPDGAIGIFHWHNPSGRTMVLGTTQLLREINTRIFAGG